MTTPELIMQQRELARSLTDLFRQSEQALDAAQTARKREIVAIELQRLETNKQLDSRFAEYVKLEQIARSTIRALHPEVFDKVGEAARPISVEGSIQTLAECQLEIERVLAGLAGRKVEITVLTVPSDVDEAAFVRKLSDITNSNLRNCTPGSRYRLSLKNARKAIAEMEALGIEVKFVA